MRIVVDRATCDGNGCCAQAAPDLFVLDDHDSLHVLSETVSEERRAAAEAAVRSCPKNALSLAQG